MSIEQLKAELEELKELILKLDAKVNILVTAVNERDKIINESKKTIHNINSVFTNGSMTSFINALMPQTNLPFEEDESELAIKDAEEVPFE